MVTTGVQIPVSALLQIPAAKRRGCRFAARNLVTAEGCEQSTTWVRGAW